MSSGYAYGEEQPTEQCPYCESVCDADFVDIGVGYQQCGPYNCVVCGASRIGPFDEKRELTDDEKKFNWYEPESEFGSSANVINGKIVSHRVMRETYKNRFTGSEDWFDAETVEKWWKEIRE